MIFNAKPKKRSINDEIDRIIAEIAELPVDSTIYERKVERLEQLLLARSYKTSQVVSMDTIVTTAGSILGIALILNHERLNVITSKALGFVLKGKI